MSATLALSPDGTHACERVLRQLQNAWMQPHVALAADPSSLSDAECMRRYRNGDAQAFHILYARHREKLHRYALRLAGKASDAEELFQDVWMAVVTSGSRAPIR